MAAKVRKVKLHDLDLTKVKIHNLKAKKYPNGQESKSCDITFDDGERVIFQISKRTVPFGLSTGKLTDEDQQLVREGKKFPKYSLELNLDGQEREKIFEFDDLCAAFISQNAMKWWKKKVSPEDVKKHNYYNSILRKNDAEKGDFPDRLKVKLPFYNGKPLFKVYDDNNKKIEIYDEKEGRMDWSWATNRMQVEVIAEFERVWDVNQKCYASCRVHQVRVHPPSGLAECAFDDDEDGEDVAELDHGVAELEVNDSEEVAEEEEEEEEVVEEDLEVEDD